MLAYESATSLLGRLRRRELSASELLEYFVRRIETHDQKINAVVHFDLERATSDANAVLGDWAGLPMTVKEGYQMAGTPTTWGIPAFKDNITPEDAVVVQRLREAGAIVFGKTNVPLDLADLQSYNDIYGTTNNPYDLDHTPGGSSGGSAAALAAGFTTLEMGSDIGGSIRNPAHCCGLFGHKPTWELIPSRGQALPGGLAPPDIAVVGPLARSAEDLQLALGVLARPDELAKGIRYDLPRLGERRLKDLRVAVWANDDICPVNAETEARVCAVAEVMRKAGAKVDYDARPDVGSKVIWRQYKSLLDSFLGGSVPRAIYRSRQEGVAALDEDDRSDNAETLRAMVMSHYDWLRHNNQRAVIRWSYHEFFKDYDVILQPIVPTAAIKHDHRPFSERSIEVDGEAHPYFRQVFWAGVSGVACLPSTAIPTGLNDNGLPIGIQVVGPEYGDLITIGVARLLESEGFGFTPPHGYPDP